MRQVLTASDEPAVVVAHSYGGIVTAEAAAGVDAVHHLLLISSYLPEVGQSLSSFGGEEPAPFLEIDPEGGVFTVRGEALAETFLQDCDPEIQRRPLEKTAWQSLAVLEAPVQSAAWQHVPSTYLVCAQDRGTPADRQREFAARAASVVELDAGHHPFLSRPAAVRDLILALSAARATASIATKRRVRWCSLAAASRSSPRSRNSSCAASGSDSTYARAPPEQEPVPPRLGARVGAVDVRALDLDVVEARVLERRVQPRAPRPRARSGAPPSRAAPAAPGARTRPSARPPSATRRR